MIDICHTICIIVLVWPSTTPSTNAFQLFPLYLKGQSQIFATLDTEMTGKMTKALFDSCSLYKRIKNAVQELFHDFTAITQMRFT